MAFKLDLSKFKKISSDDHKTTLQHPAGHQITIAHKALNEGARKQLHALPMAVTNKEAHPKKIGFADGGTSDPNPPANIPPPEMTQQQYLQQMASGATHAGENHAQGGQIGNQMGGPEVAKKENYKKNGKNVPHFADGGGTANSDSSQDTPEQIAADASSSSQQVPAVAPGAAPDPSSYNPQIDETAPSDQTGIPVAAQIGNVLGKALPGIFPIFAAKMEGKALGAISDEVQEAAKGMQAGAQGKDVSASDFAPATAAASGRDIASTASPQGNVAPSEEGTPQDPYGIEAQNQMMMKGFGQEQAGNTAEAKAIGQQGANAADIYQQNAKAQQDLMKTYADHVAGLTTEYNNFRDDVKNSQIDPKHYLNNMSTWDTVRTGIGLILGGAGAGVLHEANPVLGILQSRIEQDIDAQKANLGKKETLLSANMRQFGNIRDATDMTRLMMNGAMGNEISEQAARSASPLAMAKAEQLNGIIKQKEGPVIGQMAMRKTLMSQLAQKNGNAQQDPAQRIRLLAMTGMIPPDKEAEYQTQLKQAQDAQSLKNNTLNSFDKVNQLQTLANRTSSPIQSSSQIAAEQGAALDKLTKDTSGRVTPETVKLIGSSFPTLTDTPQSASVKRRVIEGLLTNGMHYPMLRSVGINQFEAPNYNVLKNAEKPPIRRGQ